MQHLRSPNRWSCLPTSFAMAFNMTLRDLLDEVGHDGSEILHHGLAEPYKRRSFHPQEMIDAGLRLDIAVVQIEALPIITSSYGTSKLIHDVPEAEKRIEDYMRSFNGVMTGRTQPNNLPHAVYCHKGVIYDPNGQVYGSDRFWTQFFFLVIQSERRWTI